jgi:isopentenyl-diphosphate delta-isomerase
MTGGAERAKMININLAKLCKKYNLGMGLGSCRQLLDEDRYISDFDIRKFIGERPFFANLGIAQLEHLVREKQTSKITKLIDKLNVDGLIIHVNPLQEFMQPEGDKLHFSPIDTIKRIIEMVPARFIVKEVGQGMGPESLMALLSLPIDAIETAAFGGSNFAKLESLRQKNELAQQYLDIVNLGHNVGEMVGFINNLVSKNNSKILCDNIIISGGIKSFLDGYYYTEKIQLPAIYGMASQFLKYAMVSFELLDEYMQLHIEGLKMAKAFLKVK